MYVPDIRHRWGRLASNRGTALVELAIVLPLLMLMLLAMIDFGKAFNSWIDETHLANVGARLAAVNYKPPGGWPASCSSDPTGGLACYIQQTADLPELASGRSGDPGCTGGGGPCYEPQQNAAQVCISFPSVGHATPLVGDPVQVKVQVNWRWLSYVNARLNLGTTTIRAKASMRLEGTPTNYSAGCYP